MIGIPSSALGTTHLVGLAVEVVLVLLGALAVVPDAEGAVEVGQVGGLLAAGHAQLVRAVVIVVAAQAALGVLQLAQSVWDQTR